MRDTVCRAKGEGGRRCICAGTQLVKHNARRRENRAIRRNVAEWARQHGHSPEECAQILDAPPKMAKEWIQDQGHNPRDFIDGVPAPRTGQSPAVAGKQPSVPQNRGAVPSPTPGSAAAPGGVGGGRMGGRAVAEPANAGDPAPRWSTSEWCTDELQGQFLAVMGQQGEHRDERSIMSGEPEEIVTLGLLPGERVPKSGTNTTCRVELNNGVVGYFKPVSGENRDLGRGFGQDSAQQSLHEAAAWRLASQLGPPWSEIVPPVVIREINGELGSFAMERPGKAHGPSPLTTGEWREAAFFDCLIGQQDRHPANYLISGDRLALIDHGYTFAKPGDVQNASTLLWARVMEGEPGLTYQERTVLQRLSSSPDLMGMEKILQPERAQALRARAQRLLSEGFIIDAY